MGARVTDPTPSPTASSVSLADDAARQGEDPALESKLERLREVVRTTWGFDELRPMQERAVRATLQGRDALVVMPTGGGKSLCYQAPALLREGLTVVVSPLISLMKDQIDSLHANGVAAGMLASGMDPRQRREVLAALDRRELRLLFVSPERLSMPSFRARVLEAGLSALAVDEAHCISHWGHDFRPEYRMLGDLRRARPEIPIQAFTATATPRVRADIAELLGLEDPAIVVGSFDRPNLTYRVQPRSDLLAQVLAVIERHPEGAGIIYCLRRKDVDQLSERLTKRGVRCGAYHAGLSPGERAKVQDAFRRESLDIVVATVAFGMGIDRPDVRFVVHASLPKGLEQYSQETGRAGRDGLPSECLLLFGGADYYGWKTIVERSVAEAAEAGHRNPEGLLEGNLGRLGDMWGFATAPMCRHARLVAYFGQELSGDCGACDVCLGELEPLDDALVTAQKLLSCVARCEQRYGVTHVIDVLRGSRSARVQEKGHDQLSTFGLLKGTPVTSLRSWIEQLMAQGLLGCTGGRYPTLHLLPAALPVLRGEETPTLYHPPTARKRSRKRVIEIEDADQGLYEHLRELRKTLADERDVPPYVICGNATLAALAARKPERVEDLLEVRGIGQKKAETYGKAFLEAIAAYAPANMP